MAKSFWNQKAPKHWLKSQQTNEFLSALSQVRIITSEDLVKVIYRNNGNTGMHPNGYY